MKSDEKNRSNTSGSRCVVSAVHALYALISQLLFPDAEFCHKKFEDHRQFTAVVLGILSVFLPVLWSWDYVTDSVGARDTIGLRLSFLLLFPLAVGFWSGKARPRFLEAAMPVALLASEAVFVEILNRLNTGMVFGLAGFMYCMFIAILTGQCLSLVSGVSYMLVAAALPQIMALFSLAPGFLQGHYSILIWPAAGLTVLSQLAIAVEYLKRYRVEEQLKQLSDTDALSGVGNRGYFTRMLEQERARAQRLAQPLSLLVLDIDHFKKINDLHGHLSGDVAIRHLADLCRQGSRSFDVVARVGGEEFAILLIGTELAPAGDIAERIRALVSSSEIRGVDGSALTFTVSVGAAGLRSDDASGTDLYLRADTALYAAKRAGRNRVVLE